MGRHAEWRKLVKKIRRKRIRSMVAAARDKKLLKEQEKRERSPSYQAWLEEQIVLEEFKAAEEKRLAMHRQQVWEAGEEAAMMRWREQQSRLQQAKNEKFKREVLMREEWAREQRKLEEAEELKKRLEEEKKRKQQELLIQINEYIDGNAELPGEMNIASQTQPLHPECPFFTKTGACRFRDGCSRNHVRPGISKILLIPNFYDHISLQSLHQEDYDTDFSLEFEDTETYQHFKEFYTDVLPEFQQLGQVIQFRVCNNEEPHLRGNVYVEFENRRQSLKAYRTFQGRFYAGRRLNVEFCNISSWRAAVCGPYHKRKCPKGKTCNFLHVFRNPNNAFEIPYSSSRRQLSKSKSRSPNRRSRSKSKDWNWSDGSDSDNGSRRKRNRSRSISKQRSRSHKTRRSRSTSRDKARSRNRDSSRERRRKRERRYRSRSKSPFYKSKQNRNESSDKNDKKNKKDSRKIEKELNGKDEKHESKNNPSNKSKKETTEKEDRSESGSNKNKRKDVTKSDRENKQNEGHDKKIKKNDFGSKSEKDLEGKSDSNKRDKKDSLAEEHKKRDKGEDHRRSNKLKYEIDVSPDRKTKRVDAIDKNDKKKRKESPVKISSNSHSIKTHEYREKPKENGKPLS